ncbi:MAG: rhamnogalacturonan acetylesterase [Acidobacteriota bacterium]|nr:rhamnogalacturonan acetylesterase [Acidobacteriota bacterium]
MRTSGLAVVAMGLVMGVAAAQAAAAAPVTIVLVGDSTVNAGGGWGKGFCEIVTRNVTCINEALNGRSTKSFVDEGAWAKSLADKGNYYLIQFGHNDQKPDAKRHTDPQTTYQEYLRRYIADVRALGAVPVLVTSLSRRTYRDGKVIEDLNEYAAAARAVGQAEHVAVIDLNAMSTKLLDTMTQQQADAFDAETHPDAQAENSGKAAPKLDRTHLNAKGQAVFGRMVADELVRQVPELRGDVVPAQEAAK